MFAVKDIVHKAPSCVNQEDYLTLKVHPLEVRMAALLVFCCSSYSLAELQETPVRIGERRSYEANWSTTDV